MSYSGAVYTCGLNDAYQLAHGSNPTTAPSNYLAPKLVSFESSGFFVIGHNDIQIGWLPRVTACVS